MTLGGFYFIFAIVVKKRKEIDIFEFYINVNIRTNKRRTVVKKKLFITLLLLVASMMLFASGGKEASSDGKMFDGEVVNALIFTSTDTDYMINVLAPRLKEETGIELRIDQVPYDDIRAKQLADVAGAKTYDIINPCTEWSFEYAQFAEPLTEYIGKEGYPDPELDDFIPFVWDEFNGGDEVYWFPYQPDTRIFFYRSDLLEEEGLEPPTTWDEMIDVAAKLTKDTDGDGQIDQYGFGFTARRGNNLTLAWVPFMFSAGGQLFDENNNPTFNSQAGIDALNLLIELKKYCPPDIDTYGEYELNKSVKEGLIAMGVSASAITPEIEAEGVPVKGKIITSDFPAQTSDTNVKYSACLGGWSLGVSSYSKHKDAAAYAVMWLTSKDISTEMEIHGRQHAARLSQAENAELLAVNPHVKGIVDVLEKSVIFYHGVEGAQINELLNVRIAQAVSGELSPEKALSLAEQDVLKLQGK